ncbi:hypothetical protein HOD24_00490 [Candidatus Peregrinibacteria bacterium]|nr:hypothetical protein [Candidatus Peregrinibacteria bacterium]
MKRDYAQLLKYIFKKFSILSARRTLLPTVKYYCSRKALPASDKPALFTMNILPPMATVWYEMVCRNLGDSVDIVIFDCSGKLNPKDFPRAKVQKFLNKYAATKSDEFIQHIAKNRRIAWICDDDMFPMSNKMLDVLKKEFNEPNTATVSFRPREWWHYQIDGKKYKPSSSYCIAFNRDIFWEKEKLSLAPCNGNEHPSLIGKPPNRYDTFDKANETLLEKGYRCYIVPKEEEDEYYAGFSGVSGAVMLLNHFKTPEQVINYYLTPPKEAWSGNMLFGTLQAMISISVIQEVYEKIKGHKYPLKSLPSREQLEKILNDHKEYLRDDQDISRVYETRERLLNALK